MNGTPAEVFQLPPAIDDGIVGRDRRPDRDELRRVPAPVVEVHVQPDPDDAVGAEHVGLGLHPAHRQLACRVHRLAERLELLLPIRPRRCRPMW